MKNNFSAGGQGIIKEQIYNNIDKNKHAKLYKYLNNPNIYIISININQSIDTCMVSIHMSVDKGDTVYEIEITPDNPDKINNITG